jgi:hypothetical protein
MNPGVIFFARMGNTTLENPGNRWKNPEFRENPEDSHHCKSL